MFISLYTIFILGSAMWRNILCLLKTPLFSLTICHTSKFILRCVMLIAKLISNYLQKIILSRLNESGKAFGRVIDMISTTNSKANASSLFWALPATPTIFLAKNKTYSYFWKQWHVRSTTAKTKEDQNLVDLTMLWLLDSVEQRVISEENNSVKQSILF